MHIETYLLESRKRCLNSALLAKMYMNKQLKQGIKRLSLKMKTGNANLCQVQIQVILNFVIYEINSALPSFQHVNPNVST